jgi:hypothetical protein
VLAIGNVLSLSGCLVALLLAWRLPEETEQAPVDELVTDLHTGEFAALRDAVIAEHHRRTGELELIAA